MRQRACVVIVGQGGSVSRRTLPRGAGRLAVLPCLGGEQGGA